MYDYIPDNNNEIEDIFSSASVQSHQKTSSMSSSKSKKMSSDNFKDIYSTSTKKTKDSSKKTKKKKTPGKRAWGIVWKSFVAIFLVGVITLSILTTSLTIYVMSVVDDPDDGVDISQANANLSFYSQVVYVDSEEQEHILARFSSGQKVEWTNIEDMSNNLKNAFIYTEDETFYQHEGVNFKRTFGAFANLFFKFWADQQGGSTITQQLIKNITSDNETSGIEGVERKIREIFRAMNLERRYTKSQILEAYLNIVPLANNVYGVGAAAKFYFNKAPADLTLAECASLAGMTRNPERFRPDTEKGAQENKERRAYTLKKMYDNGVINSEEYNTALNEDIDGTQNGYSYEQGYNGIETDFIDNLFMELSGDFVEHFDDISTIEEAQDRLRGGGYKIYATVDPEIQTALENKYAPGQDANFADGAVPAAMQSAFVIVDYEGAVKGVSGRLLQEKTEPYPLNRATQSRLRIGSTVKPISVYANAIKDDLVNYSTIVNGAPSATDSDDESTRPENWMPKNYDNEKFGNTTIARAVQRSANTIAVKLGRKIGVSTMFSFLENDLKFTGLEMEDENISPMTIGSLNKGVYLTELAASFQMFGNGGWHTKVHSYTQVVDTTGEVVLESPALATKAQVMDEMSATIMNRLLREVVNGGTGRHANFGNGLNDIDVIGKTGTTSDNYDRLFVGMTPDYIGAVWYGYDYVAYIQDEQKRIQAEGEANGWSEEEIANQKAAIAEQYSENNVSKDVSRSSMKPPASIWYNIMVDMPNSGKLKFDLSEDVMERRYDATTGRASSGGLLGYYKPTQDPGGTFDESP